MGPDNTFATRFIGAFLSTLQFVGPYTIWMFLVMVDFEPGGVNIHHQHPRAIEIGYVVEGTLYSSFFTSQNKFYTSILYKGDVIVCFKGAMHFHMNVGSEPTIIMGMFNNCNVVVESPHSLYFDM
jgi:oxalate decarboxylase/phosphoglucose isomerase-like protein (cupin superfamily)